MHIKLHYFVRFRKRPHVFGNRHTLSILPVDVDSSAIEPMPLHILVKHSAPTKSGNLPMRGQSCRQACDIDQKFRVPFQ